MGMKKGLCKLCEEEKDLVEQSHIIPNFFYKNTVIKEGKCIIWDYTNNRHHTLQSGIFDKWILCSDCEALLNRNETYIKELYYGRDGKGSSGPKGVTIQKARINDVICKVATGIDYHGYRMFMLGMLWRMSISSNPMFAHVKLGPKYEKHMQGVLRAEVHEIDSIGVCFVSELEGYKVLDQHILAPICIRGDHDKGGYQYALLLGPFLHWFFISEHAMKPEAVRVCILQKNGSMHIPQLPENHINIIMDVFDFPVNIKELDEAYRHKLSSSSNQDTNQ